MQFHSVNVPQCSAMNKLLLRGGASLSPVYTGAWEVSCNQGASRPQSCVNSPVVYESPSCAEIILPCVTCTNESHVSRGSLYSNTSTSSGQSHRCMTAASWSHRSMHYCGEVLAHLAFMASAPGAEPGYNHPPNITSYLRGYYDTRLLSAIIPFNIAIEFCWCCLILHDILSRD